MCKILIAFSFSIYYNLIEQSVSFKLPEGMAGSGDREQAFRGQRGNARCV